VFHGVFLAIGYHDSVTVYMRQVAQNALFWLCEPHFLDHGFAASEGLFVCLSIYFCQLSGLHKLLDVCDPLTHYSILGRTVTTQEKTTL